MLNMRIGRAFGFGPSREPGGAASSDSGGGRGPGRGPGGGGPGGGGAILHAQSLKKVGTIDLPGPKGQRFDYLTTSSTVWLWTLRPTGSMLQSKKRTAGR